MRNSALFFLAPLAIVAQHAHAADFVASSVQVVGLSRITPDNIYPLLAVSAGETATEDGIAQSINALYETGNFSDVKAEQIGNNLVFTVKERPIIASIDVDGNKMVPKEALMDGLKRVGVVEGNPLKQATIEQLTNELKQQYNQQGYYNSDITVTQTPLDNNRVALKFQFNEGKPARVVDINIIGNQYFSDKDIEDAMSIKQKPWYNVFSKSDRYAREKLAASLEGVTALYQNAGFVNFTINDAIINISPEKDKIYIELNVSEGEQYKFGKINFLGNPNYDMAKLQKQVTFQPNERYSQQQITTTVDNLTSMYGADGYYFAQVRPVPHINEETKTVDIDFFIDPVRPVYVRRINFTGNTKTDDEVLRREMRQLEGALASNEKIQLSRTRLMRTGFFKTVNVDVKPVPNTPDQVDVNIAVEEQPSGSVTVAAGYSQSGGVTFQAGLSQSNFMGTGNRVNIQLSRSETVDNYSVGYTNPYFTADGVSQSGSAYYRKTKYDSKNISNYVTDSYGLRLGVGYPIDETKSLSAGLTLDRTKIQGGRYLAVSNYQYLVDEGKLDRRLDSDGIPSFSAPFKTASLDLGWNWNTLDRGVFPTKGMSHDVNLSLAFGDVDYQKIVYNGNYYHPFYKNTVLRGYTKLGYGNDLPFWENFFAGGYGSVRGFENGTLGPTSPRYYVAQNYNGQDPYPEEVGGNAMAQFGLELVLPTPSKADWASQVRPVLFVEGGQVFDTTDRYNKTINITDIDGNTVKAKLLNDKDEDLRFSAGVGMTWITPIGPISISYAKPLNKKKYDQVDNVQFEIGRLF